MGPSSFSSKAVEDNKMAETEFYLRLNITGKNNGFPCLDILGYLKNTHKNPKFGKVRQVPVRELSWEFPGWDLSHFGSFMGVL